MRCHRTGVAVPTLRAWERRYGLLDPERTDDVLARFEIPAALDEVLLPALHHVGDGWQDDPRVIAREPFATILPSDAARHPGAVVHDGPMRALPDSLTRAAAA